MIRVFLILLLLCGPARAELTRDELARVAVDLPADAALDLGLDMPAVLIFADFDCAHICDAVLGQSVEVLDRTGLVAGRDYRLVIVGLDPRDDAAMAEAFIARQSPSAMRDAITLLRPAPDRLDRMTRALGYGYVRDDERDSFAHPAARYVIARDGSVAGVFAAFDTSDEALRDAIAGARLGTGAVATRLILLCYGFDPVTGRYSLAIWRVLTALGIVTVVIVGAALGFAHWRERRRT